MLPSFGGERPRIVMDAQLKERVLASPDLPSLPAIALRIIDLVQADEANIEKIAETDEIAGGERKPAILDDTPVLLIRVGDNYFCIEDVCTHDGQPLTDGPIADERIECPRHGARFALADGAPKCMPATEPIRTFDVEVRSDGVYASADD